MPGSDRITYRDSRDKLPEGGESAYDGIAESRGGVRGPFPVLLNHPDLAALIGAVGHHVRYEGELPDADREIAIISVARQFDCAYEWAAHAAIARDSGVDDAVVEAIADTEDPAEMPEPARSIVAYAWSLLEDHAVDEDTYETVLNRYGESGVVELTVTVGYYCLIACVLNAFEVLPDEEPFA
jgi:4-carboxymuconolactone decarboxylase